MGDFYHPLYLRDDRYKHAKACEILEETCDINDVDDVKNGNGGDDAKDLKKLEASKQLTLPGDTGVNTGSITPRMLMGKFLQSTHCLLTWFIRYKQRNRQISGDQFLLEITTIPSIKKRHDHNHTWKDGLEKERG